MRVFSFIILVGLVPLFSGWTNVEFPVPPHTANTLFYVQRSSNANTVMYEVNKENNSIDSKDPVSVFWIRYAEGGKKRALNYIERTIAYGVRCEINDQKKILMSFVASKAKSVEVLIAENGHARAHTLISSKMSQLNKIFVQVDESGWFPKVLYVEFFGKDITTGEPTYERMKINNNQ